MTLGACVLVVAVVVALSFGGWRARTDGRFRGAGTRDRVADERDQSSAEPTRAAEERDRTPAARDRVPEEVAQPPSRRAGTDGTSVLAGTPFAERLGERATLLQFSSAFCAPCRMTRQVLSQVAEASPGVVHLEVDAEEHLDLVRRLHVLRTPTTLVLGADGREVTRAGGAPRREQVQQALELT